MWQKYKRNSGVTINRFFKLLTTIGELKTCPPSLFETVKNPTTLKVFTRPMIDSLLTDKVLKMTDKGNLSLTGNALDLFKYHNRHHKHIIKDPEDSDSPHRATLRAFLYPRMFEPDYHSVIYPKFDKHQLRPDACLLTNTPEGYQIRFIEVERTDKHEGYLLDKLRKYQSLGSDEHTWSSWWKRWSELTGLPYCQREAFCFSVICKSKKTFEMEGWEWQS